MGYGMRIAVLVIVTACLASLAMPPTVSAQSATDLVVTSAADSGPGTLRQAIEDANSREGADRIRFAIPGPVPVRITLASPLPASTDAATIDATTQPGYAGEPIVELRGSDQISVGLDFPTGRATVRGFVINGFQDSGIRIAMGNSVVEGCYIGTDVSGTIEIPNNRSGIQASGSGNRIGGTEPGMGNLLSGNGGRAEFGGGLYLISSPNAVVQGNLIGTDVTGTKPLNNSGAGVRCTGSRPVLIGGLEPGAGNIIAFNRCPGVFKDISPQISVLGNSIFGNNSCEGNQDGQYGIHADAGVGPSPVTLVAVHEGDTIRVRGAVWFALSHLYGFGPVRIELFRNIDCSDRGFGQGKQFLGATIVERGVERVVTFELEVDAQLAPGESLTCTATSADGSTSAFSNCLTDTGDCELPFAENLSSAVSVVSGQRATLEANVSGSEPLSYQWLYLEPEVAPAPIPGATARTHVTMPVLTSERFKYEVVNSCGTATGYVSAVPCTGVPTIDTQPEDVTVVVGTLGRLAVAIPFGTIATYQWYEGRRGDTSTPVAAPYGVPSALVYSSAAKSGRYWCRASNACGFVDSSDATIAVVPPMQITAVRVKTNAAGKPSLIAEGSDIPSDLSVGVEGANFAKPPKVTNRKITQRGGLSDGRTFDEAIPRGTTTTILFASPSRGYVLFDYARP